MAITPLPVWSLDQLPSLDQPNTFNERATSAFNQLMPEMQATYNISIDQVNTALADSETVVDAVADLQTTVAGFPFQIASLQANIDAAAQMNGNSDEDFAADSFSGNSLVIGDWTIQVAGTSLKFFHSGTARLSLTTAGALTVEDDITAYGDA